MPNSPQLCVRGLAETPRSCCRWETLERRFRTPARHGNDLCSGHHGLYHRSSPGLQPPAQTDIRRCHLCDVASLHGIAMPEANVFAAVLLFLVFPETLPPEKRHFTLTRRNLIPWDSIPILWRTKTLRCSPTHFESEVLEVLEAICPLSQPSLPSWTTAPIA